MTAKKLLRFKLSAPTTEALKATGERTHISKSELVRLALKYALPHASKLDLGSKKSIGATEYCNVHVPVELHQQISDLAETDATAKVASVTRALIEYAVDKDRYYLPSN